METQAWYASLLKPAWAPPAWVFGPVWTALYLVIAVTFGTVFIRVFRGVYPARLAWPFALNLFFNLAFTPLQFGLRSNALAAVDIFLVGATLAWAMAAVAPRAPWIAAAQIPYLLWVTFATALQWTITYLNRGR